MTKPATQERSFRTQVSPEEPERLFVVAGTYWRIMLGVAITMYVLAIVIGGYMLISTFRNMSVNRPQSRTLESIDRSALSTIIVRFNERAQRFTELQNIEDKTLDPSK